MSPAEAGALAAIDAIYEEPVAYTGGGLPPGAIVPVIWSDVEAEAFQGAGNTAREISLEIRQSVLPVRPAKADRIERGGIIWKPNDVTRRDDIGKWSVVLEQVGTAP